MIAVPSNAKIWMALGRTDMRKSFTGLSMLVQEKLKKEPFSGHLFLFRGRKGNVLRILWWDGHGMCMFTKRLEGGLFVWPQIKDGVASMTAAQLAMLLDGLDWRFTREARTPQLAG